MRQKKTHARSHCIGVRGSPSVFFFFLSLFLSPVSLSLCLSVSSLSLCLCASLCLSLYLSIFLSFFLVSLSSVFLSSVSLFLCLSVCLSFCLSLSLSLVSLCLSASLPCSAPFESMMFRSWSPGAHFECLSFAVAVCHVCNARVRMQHDLHSDLFSFFTLDKRSSYLCRWMMQLTLCGDRVPRSQLVAAGTLF